MDGSDGSDTRISITVCMYLLAALMPKVLSDVSDLSGTSCVDLNWSMRHLC